MDEAEQRAWAENLRRNPPQLMNLEECAVFLNVGVRTVRNLVVARKIPSIKLRGRVLFVTSKVIAMLEKM